LSKVYLIHKTTFVHLYDKMERIQVLGLIFHKENLSSNLFSLLNVRKNNNKF
jgi:hypothetical protein